MNDLTIFLIVSGIVLIALIAIFTYLKNKDKIKTEFSGFEQHNESIDDVLLSSQNSTASKQPFFSKKKIASDDLPNSFTTGDQNISDVSDNAWVDNTRLVQPAKEKTSESQTQEKKQKISVVHLPLPEGMTDMVIAMSIQRDNHLFSGEEILNACKANNLLHGDMNIFHFPADEKDSTYALFSMANIVEPGTFDIENMHSFTTPGISLFMQLPLPINCLEAYNIFVEQAKLLSKSLNAELFDEKFNLLSPQIISHTIENINAFQHELIKAKKLQKS